MLLNLGVFFRTDVEVGRDTVLPNSCCALYCAYVSSNYEKVHCTLCTQTDARCWNCALIKRFNYVLMICKFCLWDAAGERGREKAYEM